MPSNIAEGKGRRSDRDALQFFYNARGSLYELETQLMLARELSYFGKGEAEMLLAGVTATAGASTGLISTFSHAAGA